MPVPERVEVRRMLGCIKQRVMNESTAIAQIYNEEMAKANLSKAALVIAATAKQASLFK